MDKTNKVKMHILALFSGAAFVIMLTLVAQKALAVWENNTFNTTPIEDWLVIEDIFVNDALQGNSVFVEYNKTVNKPFKAFWNVSVQNVNGKTISTVCTGSGENLYTQTTNKISPTVTLEWYVGKRCNLTKGSYRIVTVWKLSINGKQKIKTDISNVFKIL